MKLRPFLLLLIPIAAYAGKPLVMSPEFTEQDAVNINRNFQSIDTSLANTVTKTSTQTITGLKTFSGDMTIKNSDIIVSTTSGFHGITFEDGMMQKDAYNALGKVFDDFRRGDRTLNGDTAPSGQQWATTGAGQTTIAISSDALICPVDVVGYASLDNVTPISRITAVFSLSPGTGTNTRSITPFAIIADKANMSFVNCLHLIVSPDGWVLQKRVSGGSWTQIGIDSHHLLCDGITRYQISMDINGNTVTVTGPSGGQLSVTDTDIGTLAPQYGVLALESQTDSYQLKVYGFGMDGFDAGTFRAAIGAAAMPEIADLRLISATHAVLAATQTFTGVNTFTSSITVNRGTADDTSYETFRGKGGGDGGFGNVYHNLTSYTTTSVGGTPKKISALGGVASLVVVVGHNVSAYFVDLLLTSNSGTGVNVVSALTIAGTPAARTYSIASGNLDLVMGSGSYDVSASALNVNAR